MVMRGFEGGGACNGMRSSKLGGERVGAENRAAGGDVVYLYIKFTHLEQNGVSFFNKPSYNTVEKYNSTC
jgi:hypothetical protein